MSIAGRQRIIVGGGFGGLYAALRLEKTLARDPDVDILLVNRDNFFLFTPMLHEVAASDLDLTHIVHPVRKLLKRVPRGFRSKVSSSATAAPFLPRHSSGPLEPPQTHC